MKIAVISDTHDNWNLITQALKIIKEKDIQLLIHCGDITAPITLKFITENFNKEIHFCFGNVDGDKLHSYQNIENNPKVHCHGSVLGEIEIEGKKIAFQHYPQIGESLALSQKYDYVFYGHTHKAEEKKVGKTLLLNPGNLCNIKYPPSFAIIETKTDKVEKINLKV